MVVVNNPDIVPFTELNMLGIAIKKNNRNQQHIGILYREGNNSPVRILHLAWHYDLRDEFVHQSYRWIQAHINDNKEVNKEDIELEDDRITLFLLTAWCCTISQVNSRGKIPYGIGYLSNCFDRNGEWRKDIHGEGITCATFVMAVFESHGVPIVKREEWPSRKEDIEWQHFVIEELEKHEIPQEYIESQKKKIGASRFRPEEVAAGVYSPAKPLSFDQALTISKIILEELS